MQRIVTYLLLLLTLCVSAQTVLAQDKQLQAENALLRAEYELSRKGQIYLFLNPTEKRAEIRASGVILTTIPIQEIRAWGPYPEPGMHVIADKDRVPEREKIKIPPPGGEEPAAKPAPVAPADPAAAPVVKKFEIHATEVTDMPVNYTLQLEGGGIVTVRSNEAGVGWKEQLLHRFERPLWKLSRAYNSSLKQSRNQAYTELLLLMTPLDAQRLYWALPMGSALLIPASSQQ